MKKVVIDDTEYVPSESKGNIKIVILQRGWIMVGRFERNGSDCKLHNASVIRAWGTTKGLGEIAKDGPTSNTKLLLPPEILAALCNCIEAEEFALGLRAICN